MLSVTTEVFYSVGNRVSCFGGFTISWQPCAINNHDILEYIENSLSHIQLYNSHISLAIVLYNFEVASIEHENI